MNVLLTCDDGYGSRGFIALQEVAKRLGYRAYCFAPNGNRSGAGSSRSLRSVLVRRERDGFIVNGTPVDCVSLALSSRVRKAFRLPAKLQFDLVLSGINWGANVGGESADCSGTLAAARYAACCGVPAIAISQDVRSAAPFNVGLAVKAVKWCLSFESNNTGFTYYFNVNLPVPPVSRGTKRLFSHCWISPRGGYTGDWHCDKAWGDTGGVKKFFLGQRFQPAKGSYDVPLLGAGHVTITRMVAQSRKWLGRAKGRAGA